MKLYWDYVPRNWSVCCGHSGKRHFIIALSNQCAHISIYALFFRPINSPETVKTAYSSMGLESASTSSKTITNPGSSVFMKSYNSTLGFTRISFPNKSVIVYVIYLHLPLLFLSLQYYFAEPSNSGCLHDQPERLIGCHFSICKLTQGELFSSVWNSLAAFHRAYLSGDTGPICLFFRSIRPG